MANISTEVKKLNIFQKMRLNYALRQTRSPNFSLEDYLRKPSYIRSDVRMVSRIIDHSNIDIEDVRKQVPAELICSLKSDYDFIKGYPLEVINRILNNKIISPYIYQEADRYELLKELIEAGFSATLQENSWGYMPEIDEMIYNQLMQENKKKEAHSMLPYFEPELLFKYIDDNPELLQYLNINQQNEYAKKLEERVKRLTYTEEQYDYVSTRPTTFQYLREESKPKILALGFKNKIDMWPAVSQNHHDSKLYMEEIVRLLNQYGSEEILQETARFMPADKLAIELNNRGIVNQATIILDNLTEEQLAVFFDSQRELIPQYENIYDLDRIMLEHDKFYCIDYLSKDKRAPLIQKFKELDVEEQSKYAQNALYLLKYLSPEEQSKLVERKLENIQHCSLEGKKYYIRNNPNDFLKIDERSMVQLTAEDIVLYSYLPIKLQNEVQSRLDIPEHAKIFGKLLKKDINVSKKFLYEIPKVANGIDNTLKQLFEDSNSIDDDTIVHYVLHSKLFSAIGKLTSSNDILHGITAGEEIYGIDAYTDGQLETIQSFNINTVSKLVKTDTNYVLPYLAGTAKMGQMTQDERKISEARAKELFTSLYGEDKYTEYEECFKIIYDLEEEYSKNDSRSKFQNGLDMVHDFDGYRYHMNVPLQEFKLLFNSQIIEKCDSDLIKQYFQKLSNHEETRTIFEEIINVSYGERAANIVKSRPQLDVHSINSLECFDKRILDEYGEAFVHDTISYNIRNFSEFLEVTKDPDKSEIFKNYYQILSGILGSNVETMQKAITEFSYVSTLLESVKDEELSEHQVTSLINVLCSEKNAFEIHSLDDLNNYHQLANQQLQDIITDKNIRGNTLKDKLCENLFGIHFLEKSHYGYGTSLQKLTQLYDISEGETSKGEYSVEEIKLLNIMNYIKAESDDQKLISFIKNLGDVQNLRNYSSISQLISRIQEKELSEMNKHITTIEYLDEICQAQMGSNNPSVYKEEIEGVPIYHLNGEPFCLFSHDSGNTSTKDILTFEGQGGNSAICSRLTTEKLGSISGKYLYGTIPNQGLITISTTDANTQHIAKRTKMTAHTNTRVNEIDNINQSGNEVAMYRRQRDHSQITNENLGGTIPPMAYGYVGKPENLGYFAKKFKGTGIAIFIQHLEAYPEEEKVEERGKNTGIEEYSRI